MTPSIISCIIDTHNSRYRNDDRYAKYSPPAYKGRPSHGFTAYLPTLLIISGTCRKPSTLQNIKMQDNESLREFVKRFGQAVLQVEAYNMDVVLQIFKRSICPGTPFFESLAKKPPTTMDDLFRDEQILNARR
ncbi:hypothetical protein AAG906_011312 [Vitis piasezkii]